MPIHGYPGGPGNPGGPGGPGFGGPTPEDERQTRAMARELENLAKVLLKAATNLSSFASGIKASNEAVTNAVRQGNTFGTKTLSAYSLIHKEIDRTFSDSAIRWKHGFEAVQHHAEGTGSQLRQLAGALEQLEAKKRRITEDHKEALEDQKALEEQLLKAKSQQNLEQAKHLTQQKTVVESTIAIAKWETKILEINKALVPLQVMWGETVGRVLDISFKLQRTFLDINLNFSRSLDRTQTLLTAIGTSRGLVNLDEAAEAMRSLRRYSLDLAKDSGVIGTVSQLHAVTGMSLDTISQMVYRFKTLGSDSPKDINKLAGTFAYFARNTDLGAEGVSALVSKMDELVLTVPKDMRQNLIVQVLALGDALKKAGVNADAMLDSLEETQNIFSKEGVLRAAMLSRTTGIPMATILGGKANLGELGIGQLQFMREWMQRPTNLSPVSQAELGMRMYPGMGSRKDWMTMGQKTDVQFANIKAARLEDEKRANAQENLNKALDELTSGPLGKLSGILSALNRAALEAGTEIVKDINWIVSLVYKIPGVHHVLHELYTFFTDEHRGGFRWAVDTIRNAVGIFAPVLGVVLVKAVWAAVKSGGELISTLGLLKRALRENAEETLRNAAIQKGSAAASTLLMEKEASKLILSPGAKFTLEKEAARAATQAAAKATAEVTAKAAVKAEGGGGILKAIGSFFGKKGTAEAGAEAGTEAGGSFIGKLFGGLGKGIMETLEKSMFAKLLTRFGIKGLGKGASSFVPGLGEVISLLFMVKDLWDLFTDPAENKANPLFWVKALLKTISGIVGGLTPIGFGISVVLDLIAGALGDNTKATKENTEQEKKKHERLIAPTHLLPRLQSLHPGTSTVYNKPGAGLPVASTGSTKTETGSIYTPGKGLGSTGTEGTGNGNGTETTTTYTGKHAQLLTDVATAKTNLEKAKLFGGSPARIDQLENNYIAAKKTLGEYELANPGDKGTTSGGGGVQQSAAAATSSGALKVGANGKVDPGALKSYLRGQFANSGLVNQVPSDGARWGIKTGSAEEWASFGLAVAKQESGLNPRSENKTDPGGSVGLFQFGQGQRQYTGGRDQFDPQASADAFVKCVQHFVGTTGTISAMGETFGSIKRPNEAGQYIPYAQSIAANDGGGGEDGGDGGNKGGVANGYTAAGGDNKGYTPSGGPAVPPVKTTTAGSGGGSGTVTGTTDANVNTGGGEELAKWGLAPDMSSKVAAWEAAVKQATGLDVEITEGRRSMERSNTLKASGVLAAAGGTSYHNYGEAIDFGFRRAKGGPDLYNEAAYSTAEKIAHQFGLTGISTESGHIQNAAYRSWRDIPKEYLKDSTSDLAKKQSTEGKTSMLDNAGVSKGFGEQIGTELKRRGSTASLGLKEGAKTPTAFGLDDSGGEGTSDSNRHRKAMLSELQLSNRMTKERLSYARQHRFIGPTLLPMAAEDTLANV